MDATAPRTRPRRLLDRALPTLLSCLLLAVLLAAWHFATRRVPFDPSGREAEALLRMELNGDIVRDEAGRYRWNPDKVRGFPGPGRVWRRAAEELRHPFHTRGPNDHGIGWLAWYTLRRFLLGYGAGSLLAIAAGVVMGLNRTLYGTFNPFVQALKPISPLAWLPLLLFTVGDASRTAVLVVLIASLSPTLANTAFAVTHLRKEYFQVARMLGMGWLRRFGAVVLPAAAPTIVAGLRISFGSALIAVVPAEMLLGELGVGYLTWVAWNNLDMSGVLFAILVIGAMGVMLDALFGLLARFVSYAE